MITSPLHPESTLDVTGRRDPYVGRARPEVVVS
jgi:hypothetical protein